MRKCLVRRLGTRLLWKSQRPHSQSLSQINQALPRLLHTDSDEDHPLHGWGFSTYGWETHYRLPRSVVTSGVARDAAELGYVKGAAVTFTDQRSPLNLQRRAHILWEEGHPRTVLIVKKADNEDCSRFLKTMADWLEERGLVILVEKSVHEAEFPEYQTFDSDNDDVDFCVALGGDGTVLHLTSLFWQDQPLPPVASFAMGTLGFLTPFDSSQFEDCLTRVLDANKEPVYCTLRTRKRCEVYKEGNLLRTHHVLNECLLDRGSSPSLVQLECYIDGHHITSVQADGLIIATPTGSTAYSMAAGGPMSAPSVPCTLLTPIAPHSLSFRPLVIPESSELEIYLPASSRTRARASFDGRNTIKMPKNSSIRCTTSRCALPMINSEKLDRDWYEGIVQKLKWNLPIREDQSGGPPAMAPSRIDTDAVTSCDDESQIDLQPDDGDSGLEDPELDHISHENSNSHR